MNRKQYKQLKEELEANNPCGHKNKDPMHPKCVHCLDCPYEECVEAKPDWEEELRAIIYAQQNNLPDAKVAFIEVKSFIKSLLKTQEEKMYDDWYSGKIEEKIRVEERERIKKEIEKIEEWEETYCEKDEHLLKAIKDEVLKLLK